MESYIGKNAKSTAGQNADGQSAECQNAECQSAECQSAECQSEPETSAECQSEPETSDKDIASKMLSALVSENTESSYSQTPTVGADEQKRYLKRQVDFLSVADRQSLGDIIVMNNKRDLLRPCSEGTVINIDILPPDILNQMYNLAHYKREMR